MAGRTSASPARAQPLARVGAAEQAVVEQAGHQAGHERVAGADGVDDRDVLGRLAVLLARGRHAR